MTEQTRHRRPGSSLHDGVYIRVYDGVSRSLKELEGARRRGSTWVALSCWRSSCFIALNAAEEEKEAASEEHLVWTRHHRRPKTKTRFSFVSRHHSCRSFEGLDQQGTSFLTIVVITCFCLLSLSNTTWESPSRLQCTQLISTSPRVSNDHLLSTTKPPLNCISFLVDVVLHVIVTFLTIFEHVLITTKEKEDQQLTIETSSPIGYQGASLSQWLRGPLDVKILDRLVHWLQEWVARAVITGVSSSPTVIPRHHRLQAVRVTEAPPTS